MSLFDRGQQGNIESPTIGTSVDLATLFYTNPRLPTAYNGNAENALNYIFSALYPDYKGTVATPAALPGSASPGDYYIVSDDGDGKSAGYVWVVRDNAGQFEKKYDVDWSYEGIYTETITRANYLYISKIGATDRDASGNPVTGLYAGQTLYGGDQTLQNLTFNANSKDTTGYVQTDNTFRPTSDNSIDLGTSLLHFRTGYFKTSVLVDTLSLSAGSIGDSSGTISFGSTNLTTTGTLTAASELIGSTLTIASGTIHDSGGTLSFGSNLLTTTGAVHALSATLGSTLALSSGSISDSGGTINFGSTNLTTTGTLGAGNTTVSQLNVGNIQLVTNTISITNVGGNLNLAANGAGVINLQSAATTLGINATGTVSATIIQGGNLQLTSNTLSSTNAGGNIAIAPNGAGIITYSAKLQPTSDNTIDIGDSTHRVETLYLGTSISDGTTSIASSVLQSLRDINVGVGVNYTIFWNGSKWTASAPDTEIVHNTLSGLTTGDAGHTQFVMLAGRSGGQVVQGGTSASETLVLESTANATKGTVQTKDNFLPFTNASFSVVWSGTDLGGSSNYFRDVYTKGQHFGLRIENVSANPANSAQNIGRLVFNTTSNKLYADNGSTWTLVGPSIEKFSSDTSWDGSTTTKDVDVSASISDARTAIWQLCDNSNNYERIWTNIQATSATNVRITVSPALPAGSYRLIGLN